LVSKVHTSCRRILGNAKELTNLVISNIRCLIKTHGKKTKNIIYFDQVLRYYEQENNRTLILRGSRNVKINKASTSHARLTFTPMINAEGEFLVKHCLFSNLKKIPKEINKNVKVDVNHTGMWSENLVCKFMEDILSRIEMRF